MKSARVSHADVPLVCLLGRGARRLRRRRAGNAVSMEEPGGDQKDRVARVAGRGREDAAPALLQLGVTAAVAALVVLILVVAIVLWAVLR